VKILLGAFIAVVRRKDNRQLRTRIYM